MINAFCGYVYHRDGGSCYGSDVGENGGRDDDDYRDGGVGGAPVFSSASSVAND